MTDLDAQERAPEESGPEGEAEGLALDDDMDLPALDGASEEGAPVEDLVVEGDEHVGLDDATAEEAAEAVIDTLSDLEVEGWETGEGDAVGEDAELAEGEDESWTQGSEDDASTPLEVDEPADRGGVGDAGEEGLDDDAAELELPPRPAESGDEDYPDELELG
ncbi:MAG: hypothetical protein ACK6CU_29725 [Deltaproteobacteria bacterium]